jgi:trigger factor
LILEKVITQETLDLTDEEMEKGFEEMALGMNMPVEAVKSFFTRDPKQLEYYKHGQLEKKAIDLIIEKGSITDIEPKGVDDGAEVNEADAPAE